MIAPAKPLPPSRLLRSLAFAPQIVDYKVFNLPNTVTASGTVDLDLASVRSELLRGVFCGDTALEGETASGDVVLGQTELLKGRTSSNLDLSSDNVDTSDLLCDGVLNLDTWVDFNKVVPIFYY